MQNSIYWRFGVLLTGLLALTACQHKADTNKGSSTPESDVLKIEYAQNFSVEQVDANTRILHIRTSESGNEETYTIPSEPLSRIICMTSLQLSNFIILDETERVKGITSTRHLFNEKMNRQIADGTTAQIGIEGNFDNEVILAIDPQLILISPSKRGGYDVLRESGLPLLPHMGYQEPHPLGQAEWIKVIGLFTGKEKEACELFDSIAARYNRLKALAAKAEYHPTVMSGDMKGGNWYATGGRSFLANIFKDAGADYFMKDDNSTGGVNLDFETVYAQGADAEFWRISNSHNGKFTYDVLGQQDSRFRDFRAFREHKVIYCNMNSVPFYEAMPVHPDEVLADFIHAFHPELLPEHKPVFYRIIKSDSPIMN